MALWRLAQLSTSQTEGHRGATGLATESKDSREFSLGPAGRMADFPLVQNHGFHASIRRRHLAYGGSARPDIQSHRLYRAFHALGMRRLLQLRVHMDRSQYF